MRGEEGYQEVLKRIEIAKKENSDRLDLSNLRLKVIPNEIVSLTQLKELSLENNQLAEVPAVIASLTQLQLISLYNNQLVKIPAAIASLTQLQELYLNNNQLTEIPAAITSLTQLQYLSLSNNQLTEIPAAIASLTQLKELSLSNNRLTEIPAAIASLTQLETLYLDNNPFNPNLATAQKQGFDAVMAYLRAKEEAEIILNEAKLILIGEGEVGKSCLLGALRGDPWQEKRLTTHGIEIKLVKITDPASNTEITLNGWDFGGQRVYRPTHQLFFSAPAVYLVIWKPREGHQQGFVREWINLITNREPDAKILVVATHGGPGRRQPDIDKQELLERFGHDTILGFFHIDSKPNDEDGCCSNLEELKEAIAKVAMSLPEMGRTVPAKWQRVREILHIEPNPYLSYQAVIKICQQQGMDESQAKLFIKISHELGHLIHYEQDTKLNNIVILKPDWLAKAISFVLDDPQIRNDKGLVSFEDLSELWSNPPFERETGYPTELHEVFLRLMERFELSYQVVSDRFQNNKANLIAQLVPDNPPNSLPDWEDIPSGEKQQVQICRIVDERGQFAEAEGLFYRLIVRLHKYSLGLENYDRSVHWQRGLMLDNDYNGRALLEYIDTDIKITVRAVYPERFLSYLTEEIIWLVKDFWQGLRCNVMVSCIEPCGINKPGMGLFEVQKLIESKKKNRPDYPCPVSGCDEWQNIDKLLNNAPIGQPQKILDPNLSAIQNSIEQVRQVVIKSDRNNHKRFQILDRGQKKILSQAEQEFANIIQTLTDEAKEAPRLFSFKPVDPGFFDRPKWISTKFQLTLWCEHSHVPLPVLNPDSPKKGVYELTLSLEWLAKAAPVLKTIFKTLSIIAPVAASGANLLMDDAAYKGVQEELDLAQKSLASASSGGDAILDWQTKSDAPELSPGDAIRAEGSVLRVFQALIKKEDAGFGGLIRVQNQRREFLWVHSQFKDEY